MQNVTTSTKSSKGGIHHDITTDDSGVLGKIHSGNQFH